MRFTLATAELRGADVAVDWSGCGSAMAQPAMQPRPRRVVPSRLHRVNLHGAAAVRHQARADLRTAIPRRCVQCRASLSQCKERIGTATHVPQAQPDAEPSALDLGNGDSLETHWSLT